MGLLIRNCHWEVAVYNPKTSCKASGAHGLPAWLRSSVLGHVSSGQALCCQLGLIAHPSNVWERATRRDSDTVFECEL
ncbi:unnamed protein product [Caenorhabditis sp. 36 PRJEB53466]|nr:unnamed protein product [Caenorhabditis sp. 36 PRJEB53466]